MSIIFLRKILSIILIISFISTNITYAGPINNKDTLRPAATAGNKTAAVLQATLAKTETEQTGNPLGDVGIKTSSAGDKSRGKPAKGDSLLSRLLSKGRIPIVRGGPPKEKSPGQVARPVTPRPERAMETRQPSLPEPPMSIPEQPAVLTDSLAKAPKPPVVTSSKTLTSAVILKMAQQDNITHQAEVLFADFSPDAKKAVTTGADGTVFIWDLTRNKKIRELKDDRGGHVGSVDYANFSHNGRLVATAGEDGVRIWDVESGFCLRVFAGTGTPFTCVRFSPDDKKIVMTGYNSTVFLCDIESEKADIKTMPIEGVDILSAAFSPDGSTIALSGNNGFVCIWKPGTDESMRFETAHGDTNVFSTDFLPDGRLVTASSNMICLWSLDKPQGPINSWGSVDGVTYSAAVSSDGKRLITSGSERTASVWDIVAGRILFKLRGHSDKVFSARLSADGRNVITAGCEDKTARIWSLPLAEEAAAPKSSPAGTQSDDSRREQLVKDYLTALIRYLVSAKTTAAKPSFKPVAFLESLIRARLCLAAALSKALLEEQPSAAETQEATSVTFWKDMVRNALSDGMREDSNDIIARDVSSLANFLKAPHKTLNSTHLKFVRDTLPAINLTQLKGIFARLTQQKDSLLQALAAAEADLAAGDDLGEKASSAGIEVLPPIFAGGMVLTDLCSMSAIKRILVVDDTPLLADRDPAREAITQLIGPGKLSADVEVRSINSRDVMHWIFQSSPQIILLRNNETDAGLAIAKEINSGRSFNNRVPIVIYSVKPDDATLKQMIADHLVLGCVAGELDNADQAERLINQVVSQANHAQTLKRTFLNTYVQVLIAYLSKKAKLGTNALMLLDENRDLRRWRDRMARSLKLYINATSQPAALNYWETSKAWYDQAFSELRNSGVPGENIPLKNGFNSIKALVSEEAQAMADAVKEARPVISDVAIAPAELKQVVEQRLGHMREIHLWAAESSMLNIAEVTRFTATVKNKQLDLDLKVRTLSFLTGKYIFALRNLVCLERSYLSGGNPEAPSRIAEAASRLKKGSEPIFSAFNVALGEENIRKQVRQLFLNLLSDVERIMLSPSSPETAHRVQPAQDIKGVKDVTDELAYCIIAVMPHLIIDSKQGPADLAAINRLLGLLDNLSIECHKPESVEVVSVAITDTKTTKIERLNFRGTDIGIDAIRSAVSLLRSYRQTLQPAAEDGVILKASSAGVTLSVLEAEGVDYRGLTVLLLDTLTKKVRLPDNVTQYTNYNAILAKLPDPVLAMLLALASCQEQAGVEAVMEFYRRFSIPGYPASLHNTPLIQAILAVTHFLKEPSLRDRDDVSYLFDLRLGQNQDSQPIKAALETWGQIISPDELEFLNKELLLYARIVTANSSSAGNASLVLEPISAEFLNMPGMPALLATLKFRFKQEEFEFILCNLDILEETGGIPLERNWFIYNIYPAGQAVSRGYLRIEVSAEGKLLKDAVVYLPAQDELARAVPAWLKDIGDDFTSDNPKFNSIPRKPALSTPEPTLKASSAGAKSLTPDVPSTVLLSAPAIARLIEAADRWIEFAEKDIKAGAFEGTVTNWRTPTAVRTIVGQVDRIREYLTLQLRLKEETPTAVISSGFVATALEMVEATIQLCRQNQKDFTNITLLGVGLRHLQELEKALRFVNYESSGYRVIGDRSSLRQETVLFDPTPTSPCHYSKVTAVTASDVKLIQTDITGTPIQEARSFNVGISDVMDRYLLANPDPGLKASSAGNFFTHPLAQEDIARLEGVKEFYLKTFGCLPEAVTVAPGRDNDQGEHVDYPDENFQGQNPAHLYSMGGAIAENYIVACGRRQDNEIHIYYMGAQDGLAIVFEEPHIVYSAESLRTVLKDIQAKAAEQRREGIAVDKRRLPVWSNHALGVLMQAAERDLPLSGMNIVLESNIPSGAGLSKSAANCCAVTMALNEVYGWGLDVDKIIAFARDGEHDDFVGSTCGWLDQILSMKSRAGHLAMIDYADKSVRHFKSNLPPTMKRALVNTNIPHELATGEYSDRVNELKLAFKTLEAVLGRKINSTSLTLSDLNCLIRQLDEGVPFITFAAAGLSGIMPEQDMTKQNTFSISHGDIYRIKDYVDRSYQIPDLRRHKGKTKQQSFAILLRRMRHQLTSSLRTPLTGLAAKKGDWTSFGELINAEGRSLRMDGDFQITGENGAQDALLDIGFAVGEELEARGLGYVYGRMEGGGGGGFVGFYVDCSSEKVYRLWKKLVAEKYQAWVESQPELRGKNIRATFKDDKPSLAKGAYVAKSIARATSLKSSSAGKKTLHHRFKAVLDAAPLSDGTLKKIHALRRVLFIDIDGSGLAHSTKAAVRELKAADMIRRNMQFKSVPNTKEALKIIQSFNPQVIFVPYSASVSDFVKAVNGKRDKRIPIVIYDTPRQPKGITVTMKQLLGEGLIAGSTLFQPSSADILLKELGFALALSMEPDMPPSLKSSSAGRGKRSQAQPLLLAAATTRSLVHTTQMFSDFVTQNFKGDRERLVSLLTDRRRERGVSLSPEQEAAVTVLTNIQEKLLAIKDYLESHFTADKLDAISLTEVDELITKLTELRKYYNTNETALSPVIPATKINIYQYAAYLLSSTEDVKVELLITAYLEALVNCINQIIGEREPGPRVKRNLDAKRNALVNDKAFMSRKHAFFIMSDTKRASRQFQPKIWDRIRQGLTKTSATRAINIFLAKEAKALSGGLEAKLAGQTADNISAERIGMTLRGFLYPAERSSAKASSAGVFEDLWWSELTAAINTLKQPRLKEGMRRYQASLLGNKVSEAIAKFIEDERIVLEQQKQLDIETHRNLTTTVDTVFPLFCDVLNESSTPEPVKESVRSALGGIVASAITAIGEFKGLETEYNQPGLRKYFTFLVQHILTLVPIRALSLEQDSGLLNKINTMLELFDNIEARISERRLQLYDREDPSIMATISFDILSSREGQSAIGNDLEMIERARKAKRTQFGNETGANAKTSSAGTAELTVEQLAEARRKLRLTSSADWNLTDLTQFNRDELAAHILSWQEFLAVTKDNDDFQCIVRDKDEADTYYLITSRETGRDKDLVVRITLKFRLDEGSGNHLSLCDSHSAISVRPAKRPYGVVGVAGVSSPGLAVSIFRQRDAKSLKRSADMAKALIQAYERDWRICGVYRVKKVIIKDNPGLIISEIIDVLCGFEQHNYIYCLPALVTMAEIFPQAFTTEHIAGLGNFGRRIIFSDEKVFSDENARVKVDRLYAIMKALASRPELIQMFLRMTADREVFRKTCLDSRAALERLSYAKPTPDTKASSAGNSGQVAPEKGAAQQTAMPADNSAKTAILRDLQILKTELEAELKGPNRKIIVDILEDINFISGQLSQDKIDVEEARLNLWSQLQKFPFIPERVLPIAQEITIRSLKYPRLYHIVNDFLDFYFVGGRDQVDKDQIFLTEAERLGLLTFGQGPAEEAGVCRINYKRWLFIPVETLVDNFTQALNAIPSEHAAITQARQRIVNLKAILQANQPQARPSQAQPPAPETPGPEPKASSAGKVVREISLKANSAYFAEGFGSAIPGLLEGAYIEFRGITYELLYEGIEKKPGGKGPYVTNWAIYCDTEAVAYFTITVTEEGAFLSFEETSVNAQSQDEKALVKAIGPWLKSLGGLTRNNPVLETAQVKGDADTKKASSASADGIQVGNTAFFTTEEILPFLTKVVFTAQGQQYELVLGDASRTRIKLGLRDDNPLTYWLYRSGIAIADISLYVSKTGEILADKPFTVHYSFAASGADKQVAEPYKRVVEEVKSWLMAQGNLTKQNPKLAAMVSVPKASSADEDRLNTAFQQQFDVINLFNNITEPLINPGNVGKLDAAMLDTTIAMLAEFRGKAIERSEPPFNAQYAAVVLPLCTELAERKIDNLKLSREIAGQSHELKLTTGTIIINEDVIPDNQKLMLTALLEKESVYLKALEDRLGVKIRLLSEFDPAKDTSENMIAISKQPLSIAPNIKRIDVTTVTNEDYLPLENIIALAKGLLVYDKDQSAPVKTAVTQMYRLLARRPLDDGLLDEFLKPGGIFVLSLPAPKPVDITSYATLHRLAMAALIAA